MDCSGQMTELVPLYAVGALRGEELQEFKAHLDQGCENCRAEVDSFSRVAAALAYSADPQSPSSELRERVIAKVAVEAQRSHPQTVDLGGIRFSLSNRMVWDATPFKGIEWKVLYRDPNTGIVTSLVRMAPGASYPRHRHVAVEENYVLSGDITISGVQMKAGDYCRAELDTIHHDISTAGGCEFVSIASERNELLD